MRVEQGQRGEGWSGEGLVHVGVSGGRGAEGLRAWAVFLSGLARCMAAVVVLAVAARCWVRFGRPGTR